MNIQEAKICNQKKYIVHIVGKADTFGYFKPEADKAFLIKAIREYYDYDIKRFCAAVEVIQPETSTIYTVNINQVAIDEGLENVIADDIEQIKKSRLERIISQLISDGMTKSELNEFVKNTYEKVSPQAKKKPPSLSEDEKAAIKEIVEYLNSKVKTEFRSSSRNTQRRIKARFNEGYTVDDFKTVIDKKVKEWKSDEKMVVHLNPDTLFGSNFEKYLNQQTVVKEGKLKGKPSFDIDKIARRAKLNDDYNI